MTMYEMLDTNLFLGEDYVSTRQFHCKCRKYPMHDLIELQNEPTRGHNMSTLRWWGDFRDIFIGIQ